MANNTAADFNRKMQPVLSDGDAPPDNPLSEREMEVARLLATGASNLEIAQALIISPHTVKVHLRNIFDKLQVNSRTEASMTLVQRGWLAMPGQEAAPLLLPAPVVSPSVPAAPPEPSSLPASAARLRRWQRIYLLVVLLLAIMAIILPTMRSRVFASPTLLSDASVSSDVATVLRVQAGWQVRAPLPEARSRLALLAFGNLLYAIGGEGEGGQLSNRVDIYDLTINTWRRGAPAPIGLSNAGSATWQNAIYLAGGVQRSARSDPLQLSADLWRFEPEVKRWTRLAGLPAPLAGAVLVVDEQALYLLGGWDGGQMRDEVWRLTPPVSATITLTAQLAWQLVTRLETPRAFLGAVIVGRDLFVAGGSDGRNSLRQAARYNLDSGEWQRLQPLLTPRSGLNLVYDGLDIFAIGGNSAAHTATHERYSLRSNAWSSFLSPLQGGWLHAAAVGRDGRIYIVGGWSKNYLNANVEYQSSFRAMLPVITNQ